MNAQARVRPQELLPLRDRRLTGPVLCRACVGDHSCSKFKSTRPARKPVFHNIPPILRLLHSFHFFSTKLPEPWTQGDLDVLSWTGHSIVTYSQHFDQVWVLPVTAVPLRKQASLTEAGSILIYGHTHKHFGRQFDGQAHHAHLVKHAVTSQ